MFMKTAISYTGYSREKNHDIRDRIISMMFDPFRLIMHIVPVLMILNLCGVTNISWVLLAAFMAGYYVIDCLSDILATLIGRHDQKKDRKKREKEERMKERLKQELKQEEWLKKQTYEEDEE